MISYDDRPRREQPKGITKALLLTVIGRNGPLHGYGIVREVREATSGYFMLKESTLYPALNSLEEDGFLTGEWVDGGRSTPRRCYSITESGRRELKERHAEWQRFSHAVNLVFTSVRLSQENGQAGEHSPPVNGHPSDAVQQATHQPYLQEQKPLVSQQD